MKKLGQYHDLIMDNVMEIDTKMALELKNVSGLSVLPWDQECSKEIEKFK